MKLTWEEIKKFEERREIVFEKNWGSHRAMMADVVEPETEEEKSPNIEEEEG